ncbi:MAG: agmatine deiminase family protein, partial [Pedosphaera parvula]|nr:agmatine deiminase family protein [Pedosphaera parvula]
TDGPVPNLQRFLTAMDLLAGTALLGPKAPSDTFTRQYFAALRAVLEAHQSFQERLQKLGWTIVPVPSMPDLYQSVNYLNGLQDRTRYLMPALGGFYTPVDDAAAATFQKALGASIKIIRIYSGELQQHHGGVHCVASAFPRFSGTPKASL